MLKRIKADWIRPGLILLGIVGILLTACDGSGASGSTENQTRIDPGPAAVATKGTAVIKVRATDNSCVALAETLVRLGTVGEDAVPVLRTGRNTVLAYRLTFGTNTGFRPAWRTLV